MSIPSNPLSALELQLLSELLSDAAEEFAEHGSGDLAVRTTHANKAIVARILEACPEKETWGEDGDGSGWDAYVSETLDSEPEMYTVDCWAMDYFAKRCGSSVRAEFSSAELRMIAELLRLILACAGSEGEYTLPASAGSKALFGVVVAHGEQRQQDHELRKITDADADVTVPIGVLLDYLASKCAEASLI